MTDSRSLVKIDLPTGPLSKVEEFNAAVARAEGQANLLLPIQRLDHIPPMMSISMRVVQIDPRPQQKEVYRGKAFCGPNEVALTKVGISKLWTNAGGQIVQSYRTDDRSDPLYCSWCAVGEITLLDGHRVQQIANKEIDLRDGSSEAKTMTPRQLAEARRHISTVCESKALNRMVRGILSLKQKYNVSEIQRPFVVPALVLTPDMSDPEIRRMVTAKALGVTEALYGPVSAHPLPTADLPPAAKPTPALLPPESESVAADPWEGEAVAAETVPPSLELPVPEEYIDRADKEVQAYLRGINTVYSNLVDSVGSDAAELISGDLARGCDPGDLESLGKLGRALRSEVQRARGGGA